jgi:hypothetical protein
MPPPKSSRIGCEVAAEQDRGRCERAGNLRHSELESETIVAAGKDEIQENGRRHVNVEDRLVIEKKRVKGVDDQQRVSLPARGDALREIKPAEQQKHLPHMPSPHMPLREHDVVGHQQQAGDRRVKPRRDLGEEAVGEPER